MPLRGSHNRGIWHAVFKFGQRPLCGSRRAVMACEIPSFRDGRDQCKRCAARLAEIDVHAVRKAAAEQIGTDVKTVDAVAWLMSKP